MAELQITDMPTRAAPNSRTTKNSERFALLAVKATFDGSAAASRWVPTVEIVSDSGKVVGTFPADDSVAAGGSADATFAPFLRNKRGDIRFGHVNLGNWLDIETTEEGPKFVGFSLIVGAGIDDREGDSDFTFGRDWNITGGNDYNVVFQNDINMQPHNDWNLVAFNDVNSIAVHNNSMISGTGGGNASQIEIRAIQPGSFGGQIVVTDDIALRPHAAASVHLAAGQTFIVYDGADNPIVTYTG